MEGWSSLYKIPRENVEAVSCDKKIQALQFKILRAALTGLFIYGVLVFIEGIDNRDVQKIVISSD